MGPDLLVIATEGILIRRGSLVQEIFVPWRVVTRIGEFRFLGQYAITLNLRDPWPVWNQRGFLRRMVWWLRRVSQPFDLGFAARGWTGLDACSLLKELRRFHDSIEDRCELRGPWPDDRLRRRYENALAKMRLHEKGDLLAASRSPSSLSN